MINTPALQKAVQRIIDSKFDGNMKQFSEKYNGISRPSWIDIISGKTKSIESPAAISDLQKMFNCSEMELFKVSNPEDYESDRKAVTEIQVNNRTENPELRSLFQWLENDACSDQISAVIATARAVGFQSDAKNSSHSVRCTE